MGRDHKSEKYKSSLSSFNPRARVGRDVGNIAEWNDGYSFNPRARVGRDKLASGRETEYQSFNPRARVGRDVLDTEFDLDAPPVSIHAPAWGATRASLSSISTSCSFNPRARVGRDTNNTNTDNIRQRFNPRARVGRDLAYKKNL